MPILFLQSMFLNTLRLSYFLFFISFSSLNAVADGIDAQASIYGLVGYWPFDEAEGSIAENVVAISEDLLGTTGKARVLGEQRWRRGYFGSASEQNLVFEPLEALTGGEALTISAWVRINRPDSRWIFLNHERSYRLSIDTKGRDYTVKFQLNLNGKWSGNWLTSRSRLKAGRWYHLAAVFDGHSRKIYIDGELDAEQLSVGRISNGLGYTLSASAAQGAVDELRIWNRALPVEEVRAAMTLDRQATMDLLRPEHSLSFYQIKAVAWQSKEGYFEVAIHNRGQQFFEDTWTIRLVASEGKVLYESETGIAIASGESEKLGFNLPAYHAGNHTIQFVKDGKEIYSAPVYVMAKRPRRDSQESELKLEQVLSIDLAGDLSSGTLCDDERFRKDTSKVVDGPAGRYREAGSHRLARFAVNLPLKQSGMHLIRVHYPDDLPRTAEITIESSNPLDHFSAHSGYFTGDLLPLSNLIKHVDLLVWARNKDQTAVFTTWAEGRPAAAKKIEVYKVINDELPPSALAGVETPRRIGLYWEDAGPIFREFGGEVADAMGFDKMVQNLTDYLEYSGQNVLYHPVSWYDGPIYNSLVESRIGNRGGGELPYNTWIDILLRRFEERGLVFIPTLNQHYLPSLKRGVNTDTASVPPDSKLYNVATRENSVRTEARHHSPPVFNALHPVVQAAVTDIVGELLDRYGSSTAFGGVALHLTQVQLHWPSDLEGSYDDWTVAQFSNDTGIEIPVLPTDPKRFAKRFAWLQRNARDAWIEWRVERTSAFYGKLAAKLTGKRPDLNLVLSLWDPFHFAMVESKTDKTPVIELIRERGIDPERLGKIRGLTLQRYISPTDYTYRLSKATRQVDERALTLKRIRELDFDVAQLEQLQKTDRFAVYFHNRYFESPIGNKQPLQCEAWYHPIRWRAAGLVPAGEHFLEYYARALGGLDADELVTGGFLKGTAGHEVQLEHFSRVYRQLPRGEWERVDSDDDRVVMRRLEVDGALYLYAVNQSAEHVVVDISAELVGLTKGLKPLGESQDVVKIGTAQRIALGAYELAGWKAATDSADTLGVSASDPISKGP